MPGAGVAGARGIGGVAGSASIADVRGFMDAVARCSPVGYSLYDFPITSAAAWAALGAGPGTASGACSGASDSLSTLDVMPEIAGNIADAFAGGAAGMRSAALSPLAVRSYDTRGRGRPEEECGLRTPFQRDRDRIVHSKPFRRLKGKTQVFIDPVGDHYRTRMTHTLETTAISRGVARALRLNEELTEAIGLGHDMGHPPFGHAGEDALDEVLRERFGHPFRHNEQSLADRRALNLTQEVCDGILTHTGSGAGDARGEDRPPRRSRGLHQPRHRRRDPDGILAPADLPRTRSNCSAPRLDADRHARPRPRRDLRGRGRHPPERRTSARAMLVAPLVHVRARLPRPAGRPEHSAPRSIGRIFEHLVARGDDATTIVDSSPG